jgi:aspartate-semialdehyde dehydrogenase
MDPDVPLVVSEVNPEAVDSTPKGIIANPNCTTMVVMLPAKALHDRFGLTAMVATSFQAAGGAGQSGIDELAAQVGPVGEDVDQLVNDGAAAARKVQHSVHANTLAFNIVPLLGTLNDEGYTDEEMKLRNESRKILDIRSSRSRRPCVRVPVMVGHSIAVRATFARSRRWTRHSTHCTRSRTSSSSRRRRRWSGRGATRRRSAACAATSPTRTR